MKDTVLKVVSRIAMETIKDRLNRSLFVNLEAYEKESAISF